MPWGSVKSAPGFTSPMPEARKPSGLEKASTVLAPTLNTLVFIMIARDLGADALGSVALFISLGACISLPFDLSLAWGGYGGRSARAALHLSFMAAGLADSVARIALLSVLLSGYFDTATPWIAVSFAVGGLAALAVAAARPASLSASSARSEFASAQGGALAFAIVVGLLAWADKPLLWLLDGETSLGFYFAVQRTVVFIGAAGIIITGMVSGRFSALTRLEGTRLVTLMERYASLCVVPMTAFYLAFSEPMVETFFGAAYAPHHELVYPLAAAGLFMALAAPSVTWSAGGSCWGMLTAAGVASLAALIAVPMAILWGTNDVDISFAVAVGCLAASTIFYALVRTGPAGEGAGFHPHLPRHIACAGMMATILFWLSGSFASIGFGELVALAIFGVLLYGLLLYLFAEFMQGEWGEFKNLRGV